jgi:hypothetical protein
MTKKNSVKIIQIMEFDSSIRGLGDDGVVYLWRANSQEWIKWGGVKKIKKEVIKCEKNNVTFSPPED